MSAKMIKKTSCENCHRVIVQSNLCAKILSDKMWCGGCSIGTTYISYPASIEYFDKSTIIYKKKPEFIPSSPPWTTWNGLMMCDKDSSFGKAIQLLDPNACDGYIKSDKGDIVPLDNKIRGLWTNTTMWPIVDAIDAGTEISDESIHSWAREAAAGFIGLESAEAALKGL